MRSPLALNGVQCSELLSQLLSVYIEKMKIWIHASHSNTKQQSKRSRIHVIKMSSSHLKVPLWLSGDDEPRIDCVSGCGLLDIIWKMMHTFPCKRGIFRPYQLFRFRQ